LWIRKELLLRALTEDELDLYISHPLNEELSFAGPSSKEDGCEWIGSLKREVTRDG
jgi:hypothetical protein